MSNYVRVEHSWDLDSYITCRGCGWGTYRTPEFAHDDARRHATQCPGVQAAMERDELAEALAIMQRERDAALHGSMAQWERDALAPTEPPC